MKNILKVTIIIIGVLGFKSCTKESHSPEKISKKSVILNYAKIVHANYSDSYTSAVKMQNKITEFLTSPSKEKLEAAKSEWKKARDIYSYSEVFRGSAGPIDSEGEPWAINNEGQMNAWPLNEAYIDYVAEKTSYTGMYDESIISEKVDINKDLLVGKNQTIGSDEDARERAVSTGWHAIEFLLWGQDNTIPAKKIPGMRSYEDYTTNTNVERRKKYLKVVTALLVEDLKKLVDTWAVGGTYYNVFTKLPENEALNNILNGPYFLASFELSNERLLGPATSSDGIDNSGQEDEHSCFSDNTHRDVYSNAKGIVNVLYGEYGSIKGPSPFDLIKEKDPAQAEKLKKEITKMMKAINVIDEKAKSGTPFDLMIVNEGEDNPGIVLAADRALKELGNVIKESASKLDITTVNGEE